MASDKQISNKKKFSQPPKNVGKKPAKSSILSLSQQEIEDASNIATQAQRIVENNLFKSLQLKKQLILYIVFTQQNGPVNEDDFLQMLAHIMFANLGVGSGNVEYENLLNEMSETFQLPSRSLGYLREAKLYSVSPVVEDKQSSTENIKELNHKIYKALQKSCGPRSLSQQKSGQSVSENKQLREILSPGKSVYERDLELADIFKTLHEAGMFKDYDKQTTTNFILAVADVFSAKLVDMDNTARAGYIQKLLAVVQALKDYQINTSDNLLGYLSDPKKVDQFLLQQEKEKLAQQSVQSVPVIQEKKDSLSSRGRRVLAVLTTGKKNPPKTDDKETRSSIVPAVTPLSNAEQLQTLLEELNAAQSELVLHSFVEDSPEGDDSAESKNSKSSNQKDKGAAEAIKPKLSAQVERIKRIVIFIGKNDDYKQQRKEVLQCFEGLLVRIHGTAKDEVNFLKAKESAVSTDLLDKAKEVFTSQEKALVARAKSIIALAAEVNEIYENLKASASGKRWQQISGHLNELQALVQQIPGKYKEQLARDTSQNSPSLSGSSQNLSSSSKPRASSVPGTLSKSSFWSSFSRTPKQPVGDKENSPPDLFSPTAQAPDRRSSTGSSTKH